MSNSRIAPVRPSIAKLLKKKIGGFIREYEREVNRPAEPTKQPPAPPAPAQHDETAPAQPKDTAE